MVYLTGHLKENSYTEYNIHQVEHDFTYEGYSMKKPFLKIIEDFISEHDEYTLTDTESEDLLQELEERFDKGDYSKRDMYEYLVQSLLTDDEKLMEAYELNEEDLHKYQVLAKELGFDLIKDILDNEDFQLYEMQRDEFVDMAIDELLVIGEIPEQARWYIDNEHVWSALLRFAFTETSYGIVYTDF